MGIHMKLKDRRTFLLGCAFLILLLSINVISCVSAADNLTTDDVNNTVVDDLTTRGDLAAAGNLTTRGDFDSTQSPEFQTFLGFLTGAAKYGYEGTCIGLDIAQGLHDYLFIHHNTYHIYDYETGFYQNFVSPPPYATTDFVVGCGFAGAATAVAGAIVGAIIGEKVGESVAEWVLGDDRFKGDEEAVGGLVGVITGGATGYITGGLAGVLVGGLIGFCIGGPAGAIAFGLIGLKTGANAGLLAGAISGGFAGSDKGEEIAQNRESNN